MPELSGVLWLSYLMLFMCYFLGVEKYQTFYDLRMKHQLAAHHKNPSTKVVKIFNNEFEKDLAKSALIKSRLFN